MALQNRQIIFISDLHLSEDHPEITQLFTFLLSGCDPHLHQLYILGDLFEMWLGDDAHLPYQNSIERLLLQHTARGLPIFFLAGNRDFLIKDAFYQRTGVYGLKEPYVLNEFNKTVLLMHGDVLCTDDRPYQLLRFWFNKSWVQYVILSTSLSMRRWVAKKLRAKNHVPDFQNDDPKYDVTTAAIDTYLKRYSVDYLIHGHTHRPEIHQHHQTQRIVLGAWGNHAKIAVLNQQGIFLKEISDAISIKSVIQNSEIY